LPQSHSGIAARPLRRSGGAAAAPETGEVKISFRDLPEA
jgi:hypothetical protein